MGGYFIDILFMLVMCGIFIHLPKSGIYDENNYNGQNLSIIGSKNKYKTTKNESKNPETDKQILCCYYRQHYHNAYCGDNNKSFGCILTPALVEGLPSVVCSNTSGCLPGGMAKQGYWLEGFKWNCDECKI